MTSLVISLPLVISSIRTILFQLYLLCLGSHALAPPPQPTLAVLLHGVRNPQAYEMFPPKSPHSLLEPICWAWAGLSSRYIVLRTDHTTNVLTSRPERYPRGSCLLGRIG